MVLRQEHSTTTTTTSPPVNDVPRRLVLSEQLVQHMLALPENGMGYQRVRLTLRSGVVVNNVIVENATYARIPDDAQEFSESDIVSIALMPIADPCS